MLARGNGKVAHLQILRARAYGPDRTHLAVNCFLDTDQPALRRRVEALAIPHICGGIPYSKSCLRSSTEADADLTAVGLKKWPLKVNILIGVDHYLRFCYEPCGKKRDRHCCAENATLLEDASLRKFREIEALRITPEDYATAEDAGKMGKFEESLTFRKRYQVGFLLNGGQPDLPVNVKQAMRRITAVERRLVRSDKDSHDYSLTIRQYLVNGWAERAAESGFPKRTWYLPCGLHGRRQRTIMAPWVRSAASRWKAFFRNRLEEIQQLVEPESWRLPRKDNPADWLSLGMDVMKLAKGDEWWLGPRWLAWPRRHEDHKRNSMIPPGEERTSKHAHSRRCATSGRVC
ncbi:hypothetical protein T4D_4296 [Trichinella pseudospiralis]|uniref:Uncharacterized protein n=1 Tax=Trichinella pseudospiralis TaxID=6337 RepID=A0A0V1F599_TRIPS|nr:hypothetical protein T4D_4296 [Trichinella pseudospiralis]